jgi:hypothetical protein
VTWSSLGAEVQQVFHELMGYEEYQQDLFAWLLHERIKRRETFRDTKREARPLKPKRQVHHCCECGEPGHRGRWRGAVICVNAAPEQARAA